MARAETEETTRTLKRRGILAAAGAVVAGIVAKQASQPAEAVGEVFSIPGDYSASQIGTVWKITNTGSGDGIEGIGTSQGVGGFSTGTGSSGVFGNTNSASGIGVNGRAAVGTGVYGQSSGDTFSKGMHGKHMSNGYGVYGEASVGGFGVTGIVLGGDSILSRGVFGSVPNTGYGVYGQAGNGSALYGTATGGNGVTAYSGTGLGVYGQTSGTGVVSGVYGGSSTAYGIIGNTTAAGYSGLTGITSTPGVAALGATSTVASAFAAYFTGTTVVQGNFAVTGNKSAAVAHPDGTHRLLYCVESPEAWFEDFGEAKLVNGKAEVKLDADFAALIHTDAYHVFPVSHDPSSKGLAVSARHADSFTVTEHGGGTSTGTISWRVVAKRKDNPGTRLEKFAMPKINHPDPDKLPKPELPKPDPKKP